MAKKSNKTAKTVIVIITVIVILLMGLFGGYNFMLGPVDAANGGDKTFKIEDGSSLDSITSVLSEQELIKNGTAFKIYVKISGLGNELKAGNYKISQKMSAKEIVNELKKGGNAEETNTITIREGLNLTQIGAYLEEKKICTSDEFLKEIKDNAAYYRENYSFLSSVPKNREYILEGYLFGDTYEVYANSTPKDVIVKMLDRFDSVYTDEYKERTKKQGKTIDEIVTMAALTERETILDKELPVVAGVFYNRLKQGMKMQSCATLQYIYKDYQFSFSSSQMAIDNPYNTYKYEGLPAGPISNFREAALKAALYPEDTDYLFFVTKNDGTGESAFAKTNAEHQKNINKYSKNWD